MDGKRAKGRHMDNIGIGIYHVSAIARHNDMADNNEHYGIKLRSLLDMVHGALHDDYGPIECERCDYLASDIDLAVMHSATYPWRIGLID